MNPNQKAWQKLVEAARLAPADSRAAGAPYGFAARVAARAMSTDYPRISLLEHFSLRALGAACLLAVVAAGAGVPAAVKLWSDRPAPLVADAIPSVSPAAPAESSAAPSSSSDDPVAELVNIVS
jgi:hypothetical protein